MHRDGGSLLGFLSPLLHLSTTRFNVHWYCLHTKPQKEEPVASFCSAQLGLETYYPRLRQYRTIRRKRRLVIRPLFPRYLFCRFDAGDLFRAVSYAPDMVEIVSAGSTPTIVATDLIEGLKSWAGNEVDILTLQPAMRVGDQVEITNGPMRGLSGTILKESAESVRVTILLSFLLNGAHLNVERTDLRLIA
jgi:transcriptional antiterminator RfaH